MSGRKVGGMRPYFYFLLAFLIFPVIGPGFAQEGGGGTPIDVNILVDEAIAKNPSLEAARIEYKARSLMVKPAGTLPDPTIQLGFMSLPVNTFSFSKEDMTQKVIGVRQMFPFPGKLRLAEAVARSDADAAKLQIAIYETQLAFEIKRTFYDWATAVESVRITDYNIGVIKQFTDIAASRYSVGMGNQYDILSAQLEHSKLSQSLTAQNQKITGAKATMAWMLGRDSAEFDGAPAVNWTPVFTPDENELFKRADANNPTIAYMKMLVEKADNQARLARRERYPNFGVNIQYGQRDNATMDGVTVKRPDMLTAMLEIEAPIYAGRKQSLMAESAENMAQSARKMLANEQLNIRAEIRNRIANIKQADEVEVLYRTGIMPQSRTTVQSALANYQVGKIDILTLLTSELNLMNQELDYYTVRANREIDIAGLVALIGGPVIEKKAEQQTPR